MNQSGSQALYLDSLWKHSEELTTVYISAYGLVTILALVGNLLVVVAVYNTPSMQSSVNILIVNMSVGGILYAVCVLPTSLIQVVYYDWFLGAFMCKATAYIQGVVVTSVVYTLIAIAIDRYMAICGRFQANTMSKRTTVAVMVCIWMLAAALMAPYALYYESFRFANVEPPVTGCGPFWLNFDIYFYAVIFITNYTIPLCLITFCYSSIAIKVWKKEKEFGSSRHMGKGNSSMRSVARCTESTWRVVKMMIMIVFLFAFSWLPLYTIRIISIARAGSESPEKSQPELDLERDVTRTITTVMCSEEHVNATGSGNNSSSTPLTTNVTLAVTWLLGNASITTPLPSNASLAIHEHSDGPPVSNPDLLNDILIPLSQWLSSSNCCVNPWVYCFFSPKYRRAFKRIIKHRLFGRFCFDGSSIADDCETRSLRMQFTSDSRKNSQIQPPNQHQLQAQQQTRSSGRPTNERSNSRYSCSSFDSHSLNARTKGGSRRGEKDCDSDLDCDYDTLKRRVRLSVAERSDIDCESEAEKPNRNFSLNSHCNLNSYSNNLTVDSHSTNSNPHRKVSIVKIAEKEENGRSSVVSISVTSPV